MTALAGDRFVILSAPRTGTNLTIELLNSHPDCYCGYEIFSRTHYANNYIPWFLGDIPENRELSALRQRDPIALIDELDRLTRAQGFKAVGFKLMYIEAEQTPAVRSYVFDHPEIRIVHIHRRNLLRRLVSLRRAEQTGLWWVEKGQDDRLPPVTISLKELLWEVEEERKNERAYAPLDESHRVLHLWYEDMVADLPATARQLWSFLGLRPWDTLDIRTMKTGVDPLADAIANFDELQAQVFQLQWFFD